MAARPVHVVSDRDAAVKFLADAIQTSADKALAPSAGDGAATFIFGVSG
jgi:hypothetical protein